MSNIKLNPVFFIMAILLASILLLTPALAQDGIVIASVSWTRPLFRDIADQFILQYEINTGEKITIKIVHGVGTLETKAINDGATIDVAALSSSYDINQILTTSGKVSKDWARKFPNNSSPYATYVVFLVRKDNSQKVLDWKDLSRTNIKFISAYPETSGLGKYIFLSFMAYCEGNYTRQDERLNFIRRVALNSLEYKASAAIATRKFVDDNEGDVLITSEAEATRIVSDNNNEFVIVYPSISFLLNMPVTMINQNNQTEQKTGLVNSFIEFLYTNKASLIFQKHYFRPYNKTVITNGLIPRNVGSKVVSIEEIFGSMDGAVEKYFRKGGMWDFYKNSENIK